MGMAELSLFMAAMRQMSSGSLAGNHDLVRRPGQGEAAVGAYQITSSNWQKWTAEQGLAGADWRQPKAQESVARTKMTQLYNRYGDWRLVAVAWLDGTDAADAALVDGLAGYEDEASELATSMHEAQARGYGTAEVATKTSLSVDTKLSRVEASAPYALAAAEPAVLESTVTPAAVDPAAPATTVTAQGIPQTMSADDVARLDASSMHANISRLLVALSNAIKTGSSQMIDAASADLSEGSTDLSTASAPETDY